MSFRRKIVYKYMLPRPSGQPFSLTLPEGTQFVAAAHQPSGALPPGTRPPNFDDFFAWFLVDLEAKTYYQHHFVMVGTGLDPIELADELRLQPIEMIGYPGGQLTLCFHLFEILGPDSGSGVKA